LGATKFLQTDKVVHGEHQLYRAPLAGGSRLFAETLNPDDLRFAIIRLLKI
jgi:hypothetical protein